MLLFDLFPVINLVVNLLLCGTAFWCWRRSDRPGFLLIALGFLLLLLQPLIFRLLATASGGPAMRSMLPAVYLLTTVAFGILIFRGLLSVAEIASRPVAIEPQPLDWPQRWRQIRRVFFALVGGGLLVVAPPTAILNGSGPGVAIVAALTGVACLWLALNGNSPLAETPIPPSDENGEGPVGGGPVGQHALSGRQRPTLPKGE